MIKQVYINGKRVDLSKRKIISQGGEAYIYDLGNSLVAKIFREKDDDYYLGSPEEQKGAEFRIKTHQKKLPAFPMNLPQEVVKPKDLILDQSGLIVGYTMPFVLATNPLLSYSDKNFMKQSGMDNNSIVQIFRNLLEAVNKVHTQNVIIGDFNDLNVLVNSANKISLIDTDSFQYGGFYSTVFTDRFVDPLLCDYINNRMILSKPHNKASDWYAFSIMLFQSLLYLNPYGGVYKPKDKTKKILHELRPLKRISVFNPDVVYPKSARHYKILPDEILAFYDNLLHKDVRINVQNNLLDNIRWTKCNICNTEHARQSCPECFQASPNIIKQKVVVKGKVIATRMFTSEGVILFAKSENGILKWLYFENGKFKREDKTVVTEGSLEPGFRFRIRDKNTFFAKNDKVITFDEKGVTGEVQDVDTFRNLPVFDVSSESKFWVDKTGNLTKEGAFGPEIIGTVIEGSTLFWVGNEFGFGFYQAGNISTGFVFDAHKKGLLDNMKLSLKGQIVDAWTYFSHDICWFFVTLSVKGKLVNKCYLISKKGEILSEKECNKDTTGWLAGNIRGKTAVGNFLFAPTDDGIIRIEPVSGDIQVTKEFADTASFVDEHSALYIGKGEIYVVKRNEIFSLRLD